MDSLCDLSQHLFQFLVFFLCSLFEHSFDSQNCDHCLHSINSFNPPISSGSLVHPHICLCCFLCCYPGLSETHMDFPVLPFQAPICSPAHPALDPGTLWHSFPSVFMLLQQHKSKPQFCVFIIHSQRCSRSVSGHAAPWVWGNPHSSTAELMAGDETPRACICAAPCTRL